ncbi:hypothetical protein CEXT_220861 [Caerostris extrusa]|uniref:Receptor ligand binding region domain-containing protein n=1 Tax=Caerostris extrusa TaxID=172846 RepID=A0AAV4UR30_CAEEX|nr:hypothetical protein CEXT_220861 [Caerostris extrusa]
MYPTFARTRPPDTQISKSVASLLLSFGWMKVAFFILQHRTGTSRKFQEPSSRRWTGSASKFDTSALGQKLTIMVMAKILLMSWLKTHI